MHTRQSVCACVYVSVRLCSSVSVPDVCVCSWDRSAARPCMCVCECDAIMQDVERHVKCGAMLSVKCGGGAMRNVANIWCGLKCGVYMKCGVMWNVVM